MPAAVAGAALMGGSQAAFMAISGPWCKRSLRRDEGAHIGPEPDHVGGTMALVNLANGFAADAWGAPAVLTALGTAFVLVMIASLAIGTLRGTYGGAIRLRIRPG